METPLAEVLTPYALSESQGQPLYRQLKGALTEVIDRHFEDGQSFWSEMMLMQQFGVARGTVRQALAELEKDGLIVRAATRGTFVRKAGVTSVGVFCTYLQSDMLQELCQSVAAQCLARRMHLEQYYARDDETPEEIERRLERLPKSSGIILAGPGSGKYSHLVESLTQRGFRVVALTDEVDAEGSSSVRTNDDAATVLAMDHLTELGHRDIVFLVNEPSERLPVRQKILDFRQYAAAKGLTGARVHDCYTPDGASSFEAALAAIPQIMAQSPAPTASDPGAWAVLRWCAQQGVVVPGQLSVLGYEGVRQSRFTHPPLTSVAHDFDRLARTALDLLLLHEPRQVTVPPRIALGQSTGPVPLKG